MVAAAGAAAGGRLLLGSRPVAPTSSAVAAAERARSRSGAVVSRDIRAAPAVLDLGGRQVSTWAYDSVGPTRPIRAAVGDELRVRLVNALPESTTIHWHGLALRNDMDGVPDVTMAPVTPGSAFDYAFTLPHPGTYWFHPHVGVQLDTALHAPLIIDDPGEATNYEEEAVLVLDDWTDGWSTAPAEILAAARRDGMGGMGDMGGMGGMDDMGSGGGVSAERPLGADTGDVRYPAHLINGRLPADPWVIRSRPGRRIRLRLINAGSDTAYRVAVGGHRLTVTHTDGFPVEPTTVDTLVIGMGERYDVLVTAGDGVFPVVAVPEGKDDPVAHALLRTGGGSAPDAGVRPAELTRTMLTYGAVRARADVRLGPVAPDRTLRMTLTMADGGRRWLINDKAYADHEPLAISAGERVRLVLSNQSMMFHPMHVHGHTFALTSPAGAGPRKDTVNVLPMQDVAVDLQANNPGQWLAHCHNAYHGELGMMTTLSYSR